ncbi:response regulator [Pendulispora albinea]|uniref:Response regulator n=1 Tax=Pendulispora albinea TaxID=2741071 RepID=A0ABZ2LUQ0_9BACT
MASALRMPPFVPMSVLVVCEDPEELRTFQQSAEHMGDRVTGARDLAEAIALAASLRPELAFVDVTLGEGTGLSLVHHLQTASEGTTIYAMAPSPKLDMALEGLTLGATGMVTLPTTGDAILRAIGEVREKRGTMRHRELLEAQLAHSRTSIEAMRHLVKLAVRGAMPELMRAIADAVVDVGGAHAVAVYQPEGATMGRIASSGTSTAPEIAAPPDLERFGAAKGRETFALGPGAIVVEGIDPAHRPAVADLASFASSLVLLAQRAAGGVAHDPEPTRFETVARFRELLAREVEDASRHARKVSTVCVVLSDPLGAIRRPLKLKEAFRPIARAGDVLGRDEGDDEVWLLLPNTGSLSAQLTRRKIGFGAVGSATFPQDAATVDDLMKLSRKRAELSLRSPVRMLDLGRKGLRAIVEALLASPLLDAGDGSPFPLDLAVPAAISLVHHACIEARRGGPISVMVSGPHGVGFAAPVREACTVAGELHDVVEVDLRGTGDEGVDVIVVTAAHGTWTCCGVLQRDRFKAVHAADVMLADLLARKLSEKLAAMAHPAHGVGA